MLVGAADAAKILLEFRAKKAASMVHIPAFESSAARSGGWQPLRSIRARARWSGSRLERLCLRACCHVVPDGYRLVRPRGLPFRMFLRLKESEMAWQRLLGRYEPAKTALFRQRIRPGMTVVDVGVNKGYFALLAAALTGPQGRVLAFEPSPDNCLWTTRSIAANGFHQIRLYQMALADRRGTMPLQMAATSGGHSLVATPFGTTGNTIAVAVETLDHVLRRDGVEHIDLMKIDVEGAELLVLEGAREVLSRSRPTMLAMDLHPQLGVEAEHVLSRLQDLGFRTLHMNGQPILSGQRSRAREVLAVK